jgi:hypothetical protein
MMELCDDIVVTSTKRIEKEKFGLIPWLVLATITTITITLLLGYYGREYIAHDMTLSEHVAQEELKRFAWVGGVTNSSAEFRIRLGMANAVLTISAFEDMSSPIQTFELEGDWTSDDPYFTSNLSVSALLPATQYYYALKLAAVGLPGVTPIEVDVGVMPSDDDDISNHIVR